MAILPRVTGNSAGTIERIGWWNLENWISHTQNDIHKVYLKRNRSIEANRGYVQQW